MNIIAILCFKASVSVFFFCSGKNEASHFVTVCSLLCNHVAFMCIFLLSRLMKFWI